jgi:hypothetical protein
MQLDAILEVAIGLVFVWLVISIATLELQTRVGAWLNWRADHLERALLSMLKKTDMVEQFYAHPLIMEFMPKDKNGNPVKDKKGKLKRPDNIPSQKFAAALSEIMLNAGRDKKIATDTLGMDDIAASMAALMQKNPNLAEVNLRLMPNMQRAAADMEEAMKQHRQNIEGWFNDVMTQASSLYKLHAQKWALIIGFTVAVVMNVDSIYIAQKLWQEPTARAVIVAQAQTQAQSETPPENISFTTARSLNFPAGWTTTELDSTTCSQIDMIDYQVVIRSAGKCLSVTSLPALNNGWGIFVKLFGYLLTALAAAQGAPFWFDVLRKLVGVKPPAATGEEKK